LFYVNSFKMANPLSMEPAKSASSKEKGSNKKLKEVDGAAVSTGSGDSKKTMTSSGDYSAEGSSDVNDLKVPVSFKCMLHCVILLFSNEHV
jgi:hypothetical protein